MDARKKYMVARKALEALVAAVETPDGLEKQGHIATAVAVAKAKLEVLFELDDEPAIDIADLRGYPGWERAGNVMWPPGSIGKAPWIRPVICSTGEAGKGGEA